ncbi:FAD-binding oxidoreductase [Marinicellulosiphila megalodicopiae]|uniref:FAD-binding oxidoreductase n=1 Tax=Marinicellulosiphila megalodicopiae TaxID=2724896 RepID=UPI003BB05389
MNNDTQISKIQSWGNFPQVQSKQSFSRYIEDVRAQLLKPESLIARGQGRSYGDSALAPDTLNTTLMNQFIDFDSQAGELTCFAGTTLEQILTSFTPKGWTLLVTPGTKYITVAGAIASDVHGKNHHFKGCFSQCVKSITLMLASGELIDCSSTLNADLFKATCAGMGLTGVIVKVTLQLKATQTSYFLQDTYKANNIKHALELFEQNQHCDYHVAWIDCLATGDQLGRSVVMTATDANRQELKIHKPAKLNVPFFMPNITMNSLSIGAFNKLYFNKASNTQNELVHYDSFYYPLDGILNWNRLYGKNGFVQYQFVVPKQNGLEALTLILEKIAASKQGSCLTVLKELGEANENYLSFPMKGYTLALDFKVTPKIWALLDELDELVLKYGGRLYLCKDARMSEQTFKQSYPQWTQLQNVRKEYGSLHKFNSTQSNRLGLHP